MTTDLHESPPAAGNRVLAGFWRRLVALSIDFMIITILLYLTAVAASASRQMAQGDSVWGGIFFYLLSYLFYNLFAVVYLVYFIANSGQTPGKMAVGIKVVDVSGNEAGYLRSLFRAIGYYISSALFMAGFLWSLLDRRRQTWHDKIAGTVVVEI